MDLEETQLVAGMLATYHPCWTTSISAELPCLHPSFFLERSVRGNSILDHLKDYGIELGSDGLGSCQVLMDNNIGVYHMDLGGSIILSRDPTTTSFLKLNLSTEACSSSVWYSSTCELRLEDLMIVCLLRSWINVSVFSVNGSIVLPWSRGCVYKTFLFNQWNSRLYWLFTVFFAKYAAEF